MEEPAVGLIGRLAALDGEQVLLDLDVQLFGPEAGDGDLRAARLDVLVLSGGRIMPTDMTSADLRRANLAGADLGGRS
ncbi:hypothetical protein [Phenylobacterium sp.]|uniref:hypothetical protein n=1 Tax=Phenylobacterium sp. TaxID=1871053 RepID=UPI0025CD53B2|nr:hypothetical protein [Phenylobacterium sp.]